MSVEEAMMVKARKRSTFKRSKPAGPARPRQGSGKRGGGRK